MDGFGVIYLQSSVCLEDTKTLQNLARSQVTMPPIRTSAIPNSRQQIKERMLALQNALPIASSSSSQQDSLALPLEKGEKLSEARKSEKKKDHTAGKVSFAHLANKQRTDGKVAPHLEAYMDAYLATDPEGTARVRAATNEAVAKMMVDRPATEEGSECSIQLPLDKEIRIIESEIGSSRGIKI
ncbi:hypothetical protein LguiA_012460 [Lonicera macranthoides]